MLDIRFPDWVVSDRQAGHMLVLGLYDGKIYVRVRGQMGRGAPGGSNQPLFMKKLEPRQFIMVQKAAEKVLSSPPETKIAVKFSQFDRMSKQEKLLWVITFEKDSKMCYRLHFTDVASNQTYMFAIRGSSSTSIGSEPMSDADRSGLMIQDFIAWLRLVQFWYPATIRPYDPNAQKKGGNWNRNGGNRPNGGYNRGGAPMNNGGNNTYQNNNGSTQSYAPQNQSAGTPDDPEALPF